jgi:hypothetical protein
VVSPTSPMFGKPLNTWMFTTLMTLCSLVRMVSKRTATRVRTKKNKLSVLSTKPSLSISSIGQQVFILRNLDDQWGTITRRKYTEQVSKTTNGHSSNIEDQGDKLPTKADPTPTTVQHETNILDAFDKGIRREVKDYQALESSTKFLPWSRHIMSTARSHDVQQVFDMDYNPTSDMEKAVLKIKRRLIGTPSCRPQSKQQRMAVSSWLLESQRIRSSTYALP